MHAILCRMPQIKPANCAGRSRFSFDWYDVVHSDKTAEYAWTRLFECDGKKKNPINRYKLDLSLYSYCRIGRVRRPIIRVRFQPIARTFTRESSLFYNGYAARFYWFELISRGFWRNISFRPLTVFVCFLLDSFVSTRTDSLQIISPSKPAVKRGVENDYRLFYVLVKQHTLIVLTWLLK